MRPGSLGPVVVRLGTGLALASLALTVDNLRRVRAADPDAVPVRAEGLTVLLPVRDEAAHVVDCVRAVLRALDAWPGAARMLVLDDGSTDATPALLAELAAADPRVERVTGEPRPPGWLGKPWACHQLVRAATGGSDPGILVLVDADVRLEPSALTASAALLRSSGLDLVCPYPRQVAESWLERLVQPLLQWSWASTLPLGLAESSPRESLGAANGQLLVVDAAAYARAGGHEAVRSEVLEDLALLRAFKRTGSRGVVAEGSAVATCHMYDGPAALRAGWTKSLWAAFGSPAGAVAVTVLLHVVHVVPALAALRGSRVGLLGYAASAASRVLVARRTRGRAWPDALAHPASVVALGALTAESLVARRRGTLRWKGRPVVDRA